MKKTIKLLREKYESSSTDTPEFKALRQTFQREFKKYLKECWGSTDAKFLKGHFYLGVQFSVTANDKRVYFHLFSQDVRFFNSHNWVIRSIKGFGDWFGGRNQYVELWDYDNFDNAITNIVHNATVNPIIFNN